MTYVELAQQLIAIRANIDPVVTEKLGDYLLSPMKDIYSALDSVISFSNDAARSQQEPAKHDEHVNTLRLLKKNLVLLSQWLNTCINNHQTYKPEWYLVKDGVRDQLLVMLDKVNDFIANSPEPLPSIDEKKTSSPTNSTGSGSRLRNNMF